MTLLEPRDRAVRSLGGAPPALPYPLGSELPSRRWLSPLQVLAPDPSGGPCAEMPALMLPAPQWVPSQCSPQCSECRI